MIIPKYIQALLKRSEYNYSQMTSGGTHLDTDHYAVGYTINIEKRTYYSMAETLEKEILQFREWIVKNNGMILINYIPEKTRYARQYATLTVFDPLMKYIEEYIPGNK